MADFESSQFAVKSRDLSVTPDRARPWRAVYFLIIDTGVKLIELESSDALARRFKTSSVKVSSRSDPAGWLSLVFGAVHSLPLWFLLEAYEMYE